MDGKQQTPQTAQDKEKKPCVCSKDNVQKPNDCFECCCKNRVNMVQVSILQELPSNKRKWLERIETAKVILVFVLFAIWEALAFYGAGQIEDENIYLSCFYTIVNWSFIAVAGWYFCKRLCEKYLL